MSDKEKEIEMNNFFLQLDLEKRTGKHILFVDTPYHLDSAITFSQYIFKDIRLITLISEKHDEFFSCEYPSISIAEYCNKAVIRNPQCRVMLEYNIGDDPTRIGSEAVRDTFLTLQKSGKTDQIIPFDSRAFFITPREQNVLYSSEYAKYNPSQIRKAFIEPFYQKQSENTRLFDLYGNYDSNVGEYMVNTYFPDITISFETANKMLYLHKNPHQVLKNAWKKVADYYILAKILKNDDIDEYIIVLGDAHRVNIQMVIKNFTTQLNNQIGGKSENCINLFQTYRI